MAGTWNKDNKILPGAYINIKTNEPLSITSLDRGKVLILQELSAGTNNQIYKKTYEDDTFPAEATADDKKLSMLALKNAKEVYVYKLKNNHTANDIKTALSNIKTFMFDVLVYPYDTGKEEIKALIKEFIEDLRNTDGVKVTAVMANYTANSEAVINVVQSFVLEDDAKLKPEQVAVYVAGLSAGASITTSNTGKIIQGIKDVEPRFTKSEMEAGVRDGKFLFKVDNNANVSVLYDINSLTTFTPEKGNIFAKNRVIRTLDGIASDIARVFEANFVGKLNNNADGRNVLKSTLIEYFKNMQRLNAIDDFDAKDVDIKEGSTIESVIIDARIKPIDSVEKIYISVNLN